MTLDAAHNLTLEEMDRQSIVHPNTDLKAYASGALGDPQIMETGHGIHIVDSQGQDLIDAFAGLYCVNVGYGRTEIAEAIYEQAKKLAYFHTYRGTSNEPLIRLSDRILRMAPEGMSKIYYGMSGSDANETQVKIVWYYNNVLGRPNKKKIIARRFAYHGLTILSGSMTGIPSFHQSFDLPLGMVRHTTTPHYYRYADEGMSENDFAKKCASDLDALIEEEGPETVAAFIGEPVMGTGGIMPPPEGYWQEIQKVLDKHDVLLIADEVVCGFGRTGSNFGSQTYEMKPDLMTIAKGLTSGYIPLSGSIVGERVWEVLCKGSEQFGIFTHGYTYSGHPIGAAAAMANLDIVEGEDLAGNAKRTGGYMLKRMNEVFADHPLVGEVRGVGLLAAIEFVADKKTKQAFEAPLRVSAKVADECLKNGMIVRAMPSGDALAYAPPLVITSDEVDRIVEITEKSLATVTDELAREGTI
ncbi:MAG: aminotransferase [Rhodospirillales bacterium]|nr:aminotransferase [Rhodospirillales bacterium]MDP7650400.1 aminotransferase [Rhodospirillales bacterium]HJO96526.1 aminotransferase [Rhodospirillales bacterium]